MLNKKNLVIIVLLVVSFMCFNVSALTLNNTIYSVNKTIGVNFPISLTLTNNQAIPLYNISFENNSLVSMAQISSLGIGQSVTFNANVISDLASSSYVRIKGYYYSNIGVSNKVYDINITSYSGNLNPCDFTIIKGDSVVWHNYKAENFQMFDSSGNLVDVVNSNSTFTKLFSDPGTFKYSLKVLGIQLPTSCTITTLSDVGYVNDPTYDAIINLTIMPNYPSTTITSSLTEANYIMNFYDEQQGIFSITNTGTNVAKNVKLSGDWISFSPNNFDIEPGLTKGIVYKINPIILTSNDTNKTYDKPITISGNFLPITKNLQIKINYANVENANNSQSQAANMLDVLCAKYPDLCSKTPTIVYKYLNNGSTEVNVTTTQNALDQLFRVTLDGKEEMTTTLNVFKEKVVELDERDKNKTAIINNLSEQYALAQKEQQDTKNNLIALMVIGLLVAISVIIYVLILVNKARNTIEKVQTWNK